MIVIFSLSLILLMAGRRNFKWKKVVLPVGLLIVAAGLLFDPLFHGSNVTDNLRREIEQHFWLGVILVPPAVVETGRAFRLLRGKFWGMVFPIGLALVGAGFFFHQQHDANASTLLLMTQHRILGATLALAGITKGIDEIGAAENEKFRLVWLFVLLVAGVELLLYTEGSSIFGRFDNRHM